MRQWLLSRDLTHAGSASCPGTPGDLRLQVLNQWPERSAWGGWGFRMNLRRERERERKQADRVWQEHSVDTVYDLPRLFGQISCHPGGCFDSTWLSEHLVTLQLQSMCSCFKLSAGWVWIASVALLHFLSSFALRRAVSAFSLRRVEANTGGSRISQLGSQTSDSEISGRLLQVRSPEICGKEGSAKSRVRHDFPAGSSLHVEAQPGVVAGPQVRLLMWLGIVQTTAGAASGACFPHRAK